MKKGLLDFLLNGKSMDVASDYEFTILKDKEKRFFVTFQCTGKATLELFWPAYDTDLYKFLASIDMQQHYRTLTSDENQIETLDILSGFEWRDLKAIGIPNGPALKIAKELPNYMAHMQTQK